MKRYAWVRLLFRAMGVLFIGLSLPMCFQFASQLMGFLGSSTMWSSWRGDVWLIIYNLGWGGGGLLQLGLGVYLLFYGKRLREWCMRDEEGRCPRCDYECGLEIATCPECGLRLTEAAVKAATGQAAVTLSTPAASEVQQTLPPK